MRRECIDEREREGVEELRVAKGEECEEEDFEPSEGSRREKKVRIEER